MDDDLYMDVGCMMVVGWMTDNVRCSKLCDGGWMHDGWMLVEQWKIVSDGCWIMIN